LPGTRTTRKPQKRVTPPTPEVIEEALDPSPEDLDSRWLTAVRAADEKQAIDIQAFDLRGVTSIADVFVICHGRNPRQNQTIADEIEKQLKAQGDRPIAVEGFTNAEWILMDYGACIIHIFSEKAREYYGLDRLYRDALRLEVSPAK